MAHYSAGDVKQAMINFGLPAPTDAEVAMFTGFDTIGGSGQQAIANYVNTKTAQMKAEADNPLKQFVSQEQTRRADYESRANDLYGKLQETISAAPKLFGNLTPEQIQAYIAPITQAAKSNSADLEGAYARRGIAGSSTEANALADSSRKYNENLLSTGLGIGQQTQQAQASAIQNRIAQLFGGAQNSGNLIAAGSGQLTGDQMNNMQYLNQLPLFLQSMNQQAKLFDMQSQGPTFLDKMRDAAFLTNPGGFFGNAASNAGKGMSNMFAGGGAAAGGSAAAGTGGAGAMSGGAGAVLLA